MSWTAGARWLKALTARRAERRRGPDPADMGTAFGLDAITVIDEEAAASIARSSSGGLPPRQSRFEERLHRRSTL